MGKTRLKQIHPLLEQQAETSAPFSLMPRGYSLHNCKVMHVFSLSSIELSAARATGLHAASANNFLFPSGNT